MRRLWIALASGLAFTSGAMASAQTVDAGVLPGDSLVVPAEQSAAEEYGTVKLPFVVPFVQYGAPQRLTAGLSVLVGIGSPRREEGGYVTRGIELQGSAGQGGWRAAAGGVITPFNEFFPLPFAVMVKPSFGFARRLDAPAGTKRTMYTWSVGAHIFFE